MGSFVSSVPSNHAQPNTTRPRSDPRSQDLNPALRLRALLAVPRAKDAKRPAALLAAALALGVLCGAARLLLRARQPLLHLPRRIWFIKGLGTRLWRNIAARLLLCTRQPLRHLPRRRWALI